MRGITVLVAVALTVLACGEADVVDDGSGVPDGIEASWQLESGAHDGAQIPIVDSHPATMTLEEGHIGGTAACNGYGGDYELSDGEFSISDGLAVTEMGCHPEAVMDSERRFLEALLAVEEGELSDGNLILTGPDTELVFTELDPVPVADLIGTKWVLESLIQGDAVSSPLAGADPATLQLFPDGTFTGSTGCRTISGSYQVYGAEVQFTSWGADGECSGELWEQDSRVISALEGGFRVEIDGDRMTTWVAGDEGLVYRAAS